MPVKVKTRKASVIDVLHLLVLVEKWGRREKDFLKSLLSAVFEQGIDDLFVLL